MKISIIFLLLVGVAATLAVPERPARRFFPRRKQNEVAPPLEEESEKEVVDEPVTPRFRIGGVPRKNLASKKPQDAPEEEQPSGPRFRIGGRPSGSSFTPRKSLAAKQATEETPFAGRPLEAVANIPSARPAPLQPATPEKSSVAAPRAPAAVPRGRGSTNFIESLKQGTIPVEPSQIEELERLQAGGGRAPSRAPSRAPAAAAPRPASRGSTRRSFGKPSAVAPVPAPTSEPAPVEETHVAPVKASPPQASGNDKESRRQRLLQLNRRPRISGANTEGAPDESIMAEKELIKEMPEKALSPEKDQLIDNQIADDAQEKQTVQDAPKLDITEEKAIDETLKEETSLKPKDNPNKEKVPKAETPSQVTVGDAPPALDAEDTPVADAADSETPSSATTTTTEAPKRRGGATLKRLRNSRPASSEPRSRAESNSGRQRTRDPAPGTAEETAAPARLSSRRGGRGNSRGGAAVAAAAAAERTGSPRTTGTRAPSTRTAITRPSSTRTRGPSSRGRAAAPVEESPDATEDESARSIKPLIRRRRQFQSLSARLARRARPVIASSRKPSDEGASQDPEKPTPSEAEDSNVSEIGEPIPARLTPRRVTGGRPTKRNNQLLASDGENRRKHPRILVQRLRNRQRQQEVDPSESDTESENNVPENKTSPQTERLGSETTDQSENKGTDGVLRTGRPRGRFESSPRENKPHAQKDIVQKAEDRAKPLTASKPRETRVRGARLSTLRPNFRRFKTRLQTTEPHLPVATVPDTETTTSTEMKTTTLEIVTKTTPLTAEATTTTTPIPEATTTTTPIPEATTTSTPIPEATATSTTEATTTTTSTTEATTTTTSTTELSTTTSSLAATEASISSVSDLAATTEPSLPITPSATISVAPETPKLVRNRLRRIRTRTRPSSEAALETRDKARAKPEAKPVVIKPPSTTTTSTSPATTTTTTPSTTTSPSTTLRTTPTTTTTTEKWVPKVAPEDPQDAVNRGGFRFRLHEDAEREIRRHRGEVVLTEIGRLEDTPPAEVNRILAGLGGRRRGLKRPSSSGRKATTTSTTTTQSPALDEADYYEYYDDVA